MLVETWVVVGLAAVVAKSGYQIWQKDLAERHRSLDLAQTAIMCAFILFSMISIVVRPSSLPSVRFVLLSGVAGLLLGGGIWSFAESMKTTELSVVSPLQQTIPVFASIFEPVILQNLAYQIETIGAAVVATAGAYTITIEPDNILAPLKQLRKRGPLLALCSALMLGFASITSHIVTQNIPVLYYLTLETGSAFLVLTIVNGSLPKVASETVGYGSAYAVNLGLSITTLSLVVASKATVLFRVSLVLNVLFGLIVLREGNPISKIAGSLMILSAVVLTVL